MTDKKKYVRVELTLEIPINDFDRYPGHRSVPITDPATFAKGFATGMMLPNSSTASVLRDKLGIRMLDGKVITVSDTQAGAAANPLLDAANTLSAYLYSIQNPGVMPMSVRLAMAEVLKVTG